MKAAEQILDWGDIARVKLLFSDDKLGPRLQNLDFFCLLLRKWHHNRDGFDRVFELVDEVSGSMIHEQWGNRLFCLAAGAGCMPVIQRLVHIAQNDSQLRNELLCGSWPGHQLSGTKDRVHQSIGEAILGNQVDVVRYLLGVHGMEAHLHYRNTHGENVLHLASRNCNPDISRLLVPCFQEGVHQADNQGDTVLMRVITSSSAARNRYEAASILLTQSGTDWNSHLRGVQRHPLIVTVQLGDAEMVRILVHIGNVDPRTILNPENEEHIPQILQAIRAHADAGSTLD
ncbi:hypothetical protein N8T08_001587 [Aspergillus melleus]|uniref:Uncharacterized protein n=1 Tax=Aspergillus melleus TaxID=138277 RepID=A0ACC3ANA5_9EURO|nr:hypothetical protein N8T08_001587 [Aspergillus melleus]